MLDVIKVIGKMKYAATEHVLKCPEWVEKQRDMQNFVQEMMELTDLIAQGKILITIKEDNHE